MSTTAEEAESEKMKLINRYIYTEIYSKFLSLLVRSKEIKGNEDATETLMNDVRNLLQGKKLEDCILCLTFLLNNVFCVDDDILNSLIMTGELVEQHKVESTPYIH